MPGKEKVAVLGGGALGLMAMKQFVDDGFDATGFEARPYIGGLWKDTEDDNISVHSTTIFNTSKFRAAISDFPFPEEADVYPTAAQIFTYLNAYADHFDIRQRYRVGSRVSHIVRREREEDWEIKVKDIESGEETTHYFDRVCVATGSFYKPRFPKLEGLEIFSGKVLHSIDFHGGTPFKDQNVLVIGIHASAQDVTNALSESAKKVYLSHRNGIRLLPRFNDEGMPFDVTMKLPVIMFQTFMERNLPGIWNWLLDRLVKSISEKTFPAIPEKWNLSPAPSLAVSTPLMADTLWPFLESGFAEPVSAVKEITGPKTVVLSDGRVLEEIDTILYCTGYDITVPEDLIPQADNATARPAYDPYPHGSGQSPFLFRNIFPLDPNPKIRDSLAFVGQCGTVYPGFLQFELIGMAISQVWQGRRQLPPLEEMLRWHEKHARWRGEMSRKHQLPETGHTFYPAMVPFGDHWPWLNNMAGTGFYETFGGKFGGLFNLAAWKLWWQDRELYDLCTKGLFSPAIYRAIGTDGRKAIQRNEVKTILIGQNAMLERSVKARQQETKPSVDKKEL